MSHRDRSLPRACRFKLGRTFRGLAAALLIGIGGCAPKPQPSGPAVQQQSTGVPEDAVAAGVARAPMPPLPAAGLEEALAGFRRSCPALLKRDDPSRLTRPADWAPACDAAASATDPRSFFAAQFVPVVVGDGTGLNTGYYEPELAGSKKRSGAYDVPLYRTPADLIEVDLGAFTTSLRGKRIRGRVEGRRLVPYYDRAQIEDGALAGRNLELAWAADPYEVFFLHIQGSGRLRLPDGGTMRVGYDAQNGHDYVAIGRRLRERGALRPGEATMEGIIAWMRAHPAEGRALMRENRSYVFFRELTGPGPLGALGVPVAAEVSVAADPRFVPLGAPLWLETRLGGPGPAARFARLMVAQDSGGAIKGPNRLDLFWGAGERARAIAGGLSSQGRVTLLLPPSAVGRLLGNAAGR